MTDKSDDFFDEMQSEAEVAPKPGEASLDLVRKMGAKAAELEARINKGQALLSELKTERYKILNEQMPAMMDELQVGKIEVGGYELKATSYYKANIATDDPPEQREKAFGWVEEAGGGDIIANTVTVAFPKEEAEMAAEFVEEVAKKFHNHPSIEVKRERSVPWNRLTSWLKSYVETPPVKGQKKLPIPLEILNATVGRVVKIKEVDKN